LPAKEYPNIELFVARPASQKSTEFGRNFSSNILGVFEVCLELPRITNSKDQVGLVVDEFPEVIDR